VELPEGTAERARARFADRGIFSSVCPHEVAALHGDLAEDLAAGDHRRAAATCGAILAIDPADLTASVERIGALSSLGRILEAEAALAELEAKNVPQPTLAGAQMALADGLWTAGEEELAARTYRPLLGRPIEEYLARSVEVRLLARSAPARERELLRQILVGFEGQRVTSAMVVHFARELGQVRADGLGPYLEARQMYFATRYDEAAALFDEAAERGLPTERLVRENARLRVVSLAAIGALERAEQVLTAFDRDPYLAPSAETWRMRLEHMAAHRPRPR
jgi:hypothetical protein